MTAFWKKYFALRQRNARIAWDRAKHMKFCYAFLAPYALLFLTFYILPMLISIYYSFTYNNIPGARALHRDGQLHHPDFEG